MIHFFSPDIEMTGMLADSESLHCLRVLRMKTGDEINTVDGKGNLFKCRIVDIVGKKVKVEILEKYSDIEKRPQITIAIAPPKSSDRLEWFIEKATELGIDNIIPIFCQRNERKSINRDRLEKVAVAAMKQSLRFTLPTISEGQSFQSFISRDHQDGKWIAWCDNETERKDFCREVDPWIDNTILIGPEGDFTNHEIELAVSKGFVPVSLGDMRLRTETAALFAVSSIQTLRQLNVKYK